MNYEIDKKLAAKEHKERKASSFFLCDLSLLLRPFIIPMQEQHVAGLLPFVLPVNSLTINIVADVADFPDYTYINNC